MYESSSHTGHIQLSFCWSGSRKGRMTEGLQHNWPWNRGGHFRNIPRFRVQKSFSHARRKLKIWRGRRKGLKVANPLQERDDQKEDSLICKESVWNLLQRLKRRFAECLQNHSQIPWWDSGACQGLQPQCTTEETWNKRAPSQWLTTKRGKVSSYGRHIYLQGGGG